jgi:hypothetical protein
MKEEELITPCRALVRLEFSEESIWRKALGDAEPLLCFATYGHLDRQVLDRYWGIK